MNAIFGWLLILVLAAELGAPVSADNAQQQQAQTAQALENAPAWDVAKVEIEPKAAEILKASCARLAAAHTMSFTAVITYENLSLPGPPLAYTTKSEVTLQRPNKLRVITLGDGPASEFYYDGKAMMAFAPAENLVAVSDAPPTIDATLEAAYNAAAIYFPFTDLIVTDPYKDLSDGLVLAFYIGQSHIIGGVTTDMVAYGNDNVFVQVWIGVQDHLPRLIRAVYRDDPSRLRHQMELSNWRLEPAVAADAFKSAKAASAKRIQFARPDPPAEKKP